MAGFQHSKDILSDATSKMWDAASNDEIADVLARYTTPDHLWRGMHPFYEQQERKLSRDVLAAPA